MARDGEWGVRKSSPRGGRCASPWVSIRLAPGATARKGPISLPLGVMTPKMPAAARGPADPIPPLPPPGPRPAMEGTDLDNKRQMQVGGPRGPTPLPPKQPSTLQPRKQADDPPSPPPHQGGGGELLRVAFPSRNGAHWGSHSVPSLGRPMGPNRGTNPGNRPPSRRSGTAPSVHQC